MRSRMHDCVSAGLVGVALAASGVGAGVAVDPEAVRPLRIIREAKLEFPSRLQTIGITSGEVRLLLHVDAHGELTDHLFVAFTHYEFANEVSRTVPRWSYEPALLEGRPIASTIALSVRFQLTGMVVTERRGFEEPLTAETFMFRARELKELDEVPRVLFSVAPPVPVRDDETPVTGRARVDFYIDQNGDVRMPVVAEADDDRLGWVALEAMAKWQFEIPRRGGHAVLARASQVFVFTPEG